MEWIEKATGQVLSARTLETVTDAFPVLPEVISIAREPVTEIVSVNYSDDDGVEQTYADWRWSEASPDMVLPTLRASCRTALDERGAVRVRFVAGYEEGLAPAPLVAAAKLLLGHLYRHREGVVTGTIATEMPLAVEALIRPYRRIVP